METKINLKTKKPSKIGKMKHFMKKYLKNINPDLKRKFNSLKEK